MESAISVALRIERPDATHGFDDPAVPASWSIHELTMRAVPRLRYPTTDVASGQPLKYSALSADGVELPRDQRVGDAFPAGAGRVHVVHEYVNACA